MHTANPRTGDSPAGETTGWCETRDGHDGQFDLRRTPGCRNFISDAEHTDRLLRDAHLLDQRLEVHYPNGATNPAAAYIADYRPY